MSDTFEGLATRELTDMVALARSSGESNSPLLDHLQGLYEGLGWTASRFPLNGGGEARANLLVANSDTPSVLFDVHTDTVPPGDLDRWTETEGGPRSVTRNADNLYGLGTSDTLGSGAVLNALALSGRFPNGTAIVFTTDEEVGALGAAELLRVKAIPESVRMMVVCEPTNNLVVQGEKGFVPFDIVARGVVDNAVPGGISDDDVKVVMVVGQEAHSARPFQGKNALFEATQMDDVAELADKLVLGIDCHGIRNKLPGLAVVSWAEPADLQPEGVHAEVKLAPVLDFLTRFQAIIAELDATRDDHFKPPQGTMNVGAVDTVGSDMVFSCDMRPVPACDYNRVLDRVRAEARTAFGEVSLGHPHAALPPVWNQLEPAFEAAIGEQLDVIGKSAYTEAAVYAPAGYPVVIAGPGNLLVHRPNEHVAIAALVAGGDLYEKIARLVTDGPDPGPA